MSLVAQNEPAWDNTAKNQWNSSFRKIEIKSSVDGSTQLAYLYAAQSKMRKPLIVSLHTWSGDYSQKDPISGEILARDWNYIHPDFRGANNKPDAACSRLALSDIEDAIQFALKNTNSDPEDVHIIGTSGGGLATLAAYMNIRYPIKSFSAWAPISDLETWYWESVGRKQKYAVDILKIVSEDSILNAEEARRRSPLFQEFSKELRKNANLYIYEGIHDGYEGSVPITHSLNMYNRLVGEIKYGITQVDQIMSKAVADSDLVSEKEIINLLTKRINPEYNDKATLFDRKIHLSREYKNINLTIFEGGHEQIPQALGLIPYNSTTSLEYNILTLGDSNGQNKGGWVDQLKKMMPKSNFVNISQGGRTIGFNNNGRKDLNELASIDSFLYLAQKRIEDKKFDFVIVCLGTNDTKSEFAERQNEVVANFNELLKKIKRHPLCRNSSPQYIYVTPPPIRVKNILPKYQGGNERIAQLIPQFTTIANRQGFRVINIYDPLLGILDYYATDGVHMAGAGQEIIASKIIEIIHDFK
jgi:lysophospholipase L1-like esterase/pimeloyl-ACP methyl ester carboxylesterase